MCSVRYMRPPSKGVRPGEGKNMDLIQVLIVLIIVGVVLYMVNTYVPMAPPIKTILMVVVVLVLCLWLLQVFGITTIPIRR
jgi:Flp pilus assembly protein TadB